MSPVRVPSGDRLLEYGVPGHPLVVVVHDWYGRLPGLVDYASALAEQGFHVQVPDFYNGWATDDEHEAEVLLDKLELLPSVDAIEALVQQARSHGTRRVAVVGFSMGGWLALSHATGGSVDAVVAYYATLGELEHRIVPCPVQLHFAQDDAWEENGDPDSFVARLEDDGTTTVRYDYPGTVHSFANASIAAKFNATAAALAFARTATFLDRQLAG